MPSSTMHRTSRGVIVVKVAKDLVAASATPMVLGILAEGESYGYAILKRINELSGGELDWTEGLLAVDREEAMQGRLRRYYRLTDAGSAALGAEVTRMRAAASMAAARLRTHGFAFMAGGGR